MADTVAGTSAHSDKAIGLAVRSLPIWSSKGERRRKGIRVAGETMMSGVAQWQVRAAACELLALGLRYPGEELAEAVSSGEWVEAAHEIWCALGIVLPDDWAQDVQDADVHVLRVEATRLFVGVPDPACSPYEGYWRAIDDGVQPLMFVNPRSMAVERFCKACGLGQPKGTNEPLDHIATEFELLQYLAALEAGIAQPLEGCPPVENFPEGGAGAAYSAFMHDHVLAFAPRFASLLEKKTRLPLYRSMARLLASFLAQSG